MSEAITPFETIRKTDEAGNEYWSARDLSRVLDYGEFRFFKNVIKKAETACENSGQVITDHIVQTHDMIDTGKGARRKVEIFFLNQQNVYVN
jgi:DNA-damage-inducible protein D